MGGPCDLTVKKECGGGGGETKILTSCKQKELLIEPEVAEDW